MEHPALAKMQNLYFTTTNDIIFPNFNYLVYRFTFIFNYPRLATSEGIWGVSRLRKGT